MNKLLIDFLIKNNLTLSSSESFTGGIFASSIISNAGASKFFLGGYIAYSMEMKHNMLGIDFSVMKKFGTISSEISEIMAKNTSLKTNSSISISFTGNAGPIPDENKPIGLYFISIYYQEKLFTKRIQLEKKYNRKEIQNHGVKQGFLFLEEILLGE